MAEVYCILECRVTFNDGRTEIHRPTYKEISVVPALVDKFTVINYLKETLKDVINIEVIDTLFFRTEQDYKNYIDTQ